MLSKVMINWSWSWSIAWWTFISGADSSSSSSSSSLLLPTLSAIWLPSLSFPFPSLKKKSLSISLYYPFPSQIITIFPTKRSKSSRRDLASGGLKPSEGFLTLQIPIDNMLLAERHRYTVYHPDHFDEQRRPTYGFQGSWRCHGLTRATLVGSLMLLIASW